MSKRFALGVLTLAVIALATGCSSGKVFIREGAEPIDMTTEKMLILPCDAYGFSSLGLSELEVSAALFAGIVNKFGASGISLEPAKPVFEAAGLDGMARKLAYGVYHVIDFHNSFSLDDGCGEGIETVPTAIAQLVTLAAEKLNFDFKPRYIYALYLWAYGSGTIPGTAKCRVIACIYDLDQKLVHSCTYMTKTISKDLALAEAATIPGETFDIIMEKAAKKQEAAAEGQQ